MRKRRRGVSFSPVSRLASPNACSAITSPRRVIAMMTRGYCDVVS